jgi:hypothetical protein
MYNYMLNVAQTHYRSYGDFPALLVVEDSGALP